MAGQHAAPSVLPMFLMATAPLMCMPAQAQSKNPKNLTAARAAVTRASLAIVSTYTEFLLQLANYYGASIDVAHACGRMDMLPLALQQNELFLPITKAFASGLGAPSDALAALEAAVNANAGYNVVGVSNHAGGQLTLCRESELGQS